MPSRHTRRMIGPDLASVAVEPSYDVILESHDDADPSSYDNLEWIAATHTADGRNVYALVHNEYHGWEHFPDDCPTHRACWYNSITLAKSTDGGASYRHLAAPDHRIATFPYRYASGTGPQGYFSPSSIVEKDQWHYALMRAHNGPRHAAAYPAQPRGDCIVRTDDLTDPSSWRGWDGSGFTVRFVDPYRDRFVPEQHVCAPVSQDPPLEGRKPGDWGYSPGMMTESLTCNTHFGSYLKVGLTWRPSAKGEPLWGVYYSLSDDLIEWSERELMARVHPRYVWRRPSHGMSGAILYPAVLDPASADRNFATTGQVNELYFTVFHYRVDSRGHHRIDGKNRDLVKVPFSFR